MARSWAYDGEGRLIARQQQLSYQQWRIGPKICSNVSASEALAAGAQAVNSRRQ